jgi:hypothetical protein
MYKVKHFFEALKDVVLDCICVFLLSIPGFANWIEPREKH